MYTLKQGANYLAKYIGEESDQCLLSGAVCVAPLIDLQACSYHMQQSWLSRFYDMILTSAVIRVISSSALVFFPEDTSRHPKPPIRHHFHRNIVSHRMFHTFLHTHAIFVTYTAQTKEVTNLSREHEHKSGNIEQRYIPSELHREHNKSLLMYHKHHTLSDLSVYKPYMSMKMKSLREFDQYMTSPSFGFRYDYYTPRNDHSMCVYE